MIKNKEKYLFITRIIFLIFIVCYNTNSYAKDYSQYLSIYDVKFYFFDLQVTNMAPKIEGSVGIYAELTSTTSDSLAFELVDEARIDSILLNNNRISFAHSEDFIRIALADTVLPGDLLIITVFYNLTDNSEPDDRGIATKIFSDGKSLTWSLSEPFYSKNWFPCKQILSDKADSAYLYFTVADSLLVGSNGVLRNIIPLNSGQLRFEWAMRYPVAFYLPSFAVANYMDYSFKASVENHDSVLVQNYIINDSSYLLENKEDIDATASLITLFSEKFGPYPFIHEKYGHCIVPIGGGMEHQTMTTLGNFDFNLVAHELAHQWFGDYVTCDNWQDIWINEGFASYAEFIAIEALKSVEEKSAWLNDAFSLTMSEPSGSICIPDADSTNDDRIFNYRLTYRKGAYIIHMIRHELNNDEIFFEVLKTFLQRFSNNTASAEDFRNTLEDISQQNFETFFNQWYYGEGYPILSIQWEHKNDTLKIKIDQQTSNHARTPFFELSIDFRIFYLGGDTLIRVKQSSPKMVYSIPMDKNVYKISPDSENWILKEIRSIERILLDDSIRFSVFPNPATDFFYVENIDFGLPYTVRVYDAKGILLYETESAEAFHQIPLTTFVKGVYQVVLTREKHKEIFKLAKV